MDGSGLGSKNKFKKKKPLIGATSISAYLHFEQCMLKNIIAHNVSNIFNVNLRKEDWIGHFFFFP